MSSLNYSERFFGGGTLHNAQSHREKRFVRLRMHSSLHSQSPIQVLHSRTYRRTVSPLRSLHQPFRF